MDDIVEGMDQLSDIISASESGKVLTKDEKGKMVLADMTKEDHEKGLSKKERSLTNSKNLF